MAVAAKKKMTRKAVTGKTLQQAGKLLWAEPACGHKIAEELLQDAEKAVAQLVPCLSESNDEQATQAFFALEAMVMAALNPEAAPEQCRALVAGLCRQLPAARDAYSRTQLIRYLGLLGCDCVEALRPWLDEKEYFDVTLLALRHIGSLSALELIREKMSTAKGSAFTALVLAAADWEDGEMMDPAKIRKALANAPETELPALWNACARCGLTFIADDLLKACNGSSNVTMAAARANLALLISNICEWEAAVALGQQFYKASPTAIALRCWVDACGTDITVDCYEALTDAAVQETEPILRETAIELLGKVSENDVATEILVEFAGALKSPSAKAPMVRMLGRHGKIIARPFIMACLWDKEPEVRQAAREAIETLEGKLDAANAIAVAVHRN